MNKKYIFNSLVVVFFFGFVFNFALAQNSWVPPSGPPASSNNVPGPINVGIDLQTKAGGLIVGLNNGVVTGGLRVGGPSVLNDVVIIGTNPTTGAGGNQGYLFNKNDNLVATEKTKSNNLFSKLSNLFGFNNFFKKTDRVLADNNPNCNPPCVGADECMYFAEFPNNPYQCVDPLVNMVFNVNPSTITAGSGVDIVWTAGNENYICLASAVPANSAWSGPVASWSGTKHINSLSQTTTFSLYCYHSTYNATSAHPSVKTMTSTVNVTGSIPPVGGDPGTISTTENKLIVYGNSYFDGTVKVSGKKVCLEDGTNCQTATSTGGGTTQQLIGFGGTYATNDAIQPGVSGYCVNGNPLHGNSCSCVSGSTEYTMGKYTQIKKQSGGSAWENIPLTNNLYAVSAANTNAFENTVRNITLHGCYILP